MVSNTVPPPSGWHPVKGWQFVYNISHNRWETYRLPSLWPEGMFDWLYQNFGHPAILSADRTAKWNYNNGRLCFYDEKYMNWFIMRWS